MSYITEIFDRLDLQNIRAFLLQGVDCAEISNQNYKERLDDAENPVLEMIEKKFPDMDENEKLSGDVLYYATVTQNVYMEIGMQCGAILAMRLLANLLRGTTAG